MSIVIKNLIVLMVCPDLEVQSNWINGFNYKIRSTKNNFLNSFLKSLQ